MKSKKIVSIILSISLLVLAAGCGSKPADTGNTGTATPDIKEIKVGLLNSMTGIAMNAGGMATYRGAQIAIDMTNAKGGVLGKYKVTPVIEDDKSDPKEAARLADKLIKQDKVPVIAGIFSSSSALPIADICEANKTAMWVNIASADELLKDKNRQYVFRPIATASAYGKSSVDFIVESYAKFGAAKATDLKIALVYENSPFGSGIAKGNLARLEKFKMNVVANESYPKTATDLTDVVKKLKAANPDIILHAGYAPDTVAFFTSAKAQNLKTKAIIGEALYTSAIPAVRKALGEDVAKYVFDVSVPIPSNIEKSKLKPGIGEITEEFVTMFKQKYPDVPNYTVDSVSFVHTWILLNDVLPIAIQKYGSVTPDTIKKAAMELNIPEKSTGIGYGVKFLPAGDSNSGQNELAFHAVQQWNGKEWKIVWPSSLKSADAVIPLPKDNPFAK